MNIVLFLCSIVVCLIGVATFVVGMTGRAKKDGVLEQKINQAISGIEDIKADMKGVSNGQQSLAIVVQSHEEQIKNLYRMYDNSDTTKQALITIMTTLKQMEGNVK